MNFVGMTGRFGQDPDLKYGKSGAAYTTFSIAQKTKRQGQEKTNWYDCVAFGKTAELIAQRYQKGDQIGITGSLSDESYTDQQGVKHKKYVIIANQVSFEASIQSRNNQQQTTQPQMPVGQVPTPGGNTPGMQDPGTVQGSIIDDPF